MKNYIVYKITNKLNNYIYIGVHVTDNINDKYMGSGNNIKKIIKQFKNENFIKDILYCFDNEKDMLDKEAELVNREFIARSDTYNIILGGGGFLTTDTISIKDKDNNYFRVHKTDTRYLSGELVGCTVGKVNVKKQDGTTLQVDKTDPRYLSGELVGCTKNTVTVQDIVGNTLKVNITDSRYLSGELIPINKNMVTVQDINGNNLKVLNTDPRYLSGELVGCTNGKTGFKHSELTKQHMSDCKVGEKNNMFGKHHSEKSKEQLRKTLTKLGLGAVTFYVYDIDGNFISEETGIKKYARQNNLRHACIIAALKGRIKTSGKKRFFYEYKGEKLLLND